MGATPHRARPRLIGALLLTLALLVWPGAGVARAQGPGVVAGTVVNGTTETPVAGGEVTLHTFKGQEYQGERKGRTNDRGEFRFDGLDAGADFAYEVTANQAGITYESRPVQIDAAAPEQRVDVTVYETTTSNPGVRVQRSVLIIGSVDVEKQVLVISELLILSNPSKRTFLPSPGGPDGPMGLLRFGLPSGAQDLRPTRGFDPSQIIQIDRGFASLSPVLPGDHEYGYVFRLPYQGSRLPFEKSLLYGAGILQIFAPESGPLVTSPELTPGETVDLGGTRYRIWSARDVAPGSRLTLDLTDIPQPPFSTVARNLALQPVTFAALLTLILIGGSFWAFRSRPDPVLAPAVGPANAAALIDDLATLDDEYEAGRLTEAAYRARRSTLKRQLRDVVESGAALPEPDRAAAISGEGARG